MNRSYVANISKATYAYWFMPWEPHPASVSGEPCFRIKWNLGAFSGPCLGYTVGWTSPSSDHSAVCNEIQLCSCRNSACVHVLDCTVGALCGPAYRETSVTAQGDSASSHCSMLHSCGEFRSKQAQRQGVSPLWNTKGVENVPLALYPAPANQLYVTLCL